MSRIKRKKQLGEIGIDLLIDESLFQELNNRYNSALNAVDLESKIKRLKELKEILEPYRQEASRLLGNTSDREIKRKIENIMNMYDSLEDHLGHEKERLYKKARRGLTREELKVAQLIGEEFYLDLVSMSNKTNRKGILNALHIKIPGAILALTMLIYTGIRIDTTLKLRKKIIEEDRRPQVERVDYKLGGLEKEFKKYKSLTRDPLVVYLDKKVLKKENKHKENKNNRESLHKKVFYTKDRYIERQINKNSLEKALKEYISEKGLLGYEKEGMLRIIEYLHTNSYKNAEALRCIPRIVEEQFGRGIDLVIYIDKDLDYGALYSKDKRIDTGLSSRNYSLLFFPVTIGSKQPYSDPGKGHTPEGVYALGEFKRIDHPLYGSRWAPIGFPTRRELERGVKPPKKRLLLCGTGMEDRKRAIMNGVDNTYGSVVTLNYFIEEIARLRNRARNAVIIIEHSDRPLGGYQ